MGESEEEEAGESWRKPPSSVSSSLLRTGVSSSMIVFEDEMGMVVLRDRFGGRCFLDMIVERRRRRRRRGRGRGERRQGERFGWNVDIHHVWPIFSRNSGDEIH